MTQGWNPLRRGVTPGLVVLAAVGLVGCGGSGGGNSASTVNAIKANWSAFFSPSTTATQKEQLLQNGTMFTSIITSLATNPLAKSASASVTSVSLHGDTADVTYDVKLGGRTVLTGEKGTAVKEGGHWLVSEASFCGLAELELGKKPANCP